MNREGNSYTFIYASAMVIVVAALLATVATALKPYQDKNVEIAKKIEILSSVNVAATAENAEALYQKHITQTMVVNSTGATVDGEAFAVDLAVEIRKAAADRQLPVYIASTDAGTKYVLPVRGKGLWGPIWGNVSLNEDRTTIYGATFGHAGETPGLGAEIATPAFQDQFAGKSLIVDGNVAFNVIKGGAPAGMPNGVDAVSGGTITSKGLEDMLNDCLSVYQSYLNK